ncbi:MAG: MFS transporter [Pseudomonadota bacterium]
MLSEHDYDPPRAHKALAFSTLAFTVCFAVWTIFSVIGVKIKQDLGLSDTQFGLLVATPVLTGSISRIFLGMWTERFGGRLVFTILMLATSVAVFLLSTVTTYGLFLVAALGIGLAGGSFIVGIAYTSEWYDKKHQGTALGIFGAGNVGAAVTNFGAPFLVVALGWEMTAQVYAAILAGMAVLFWFMTENDPRLTRRAEEGSQPMPVKEQLAPLKKLQVWRFSLYYFFVFGAFVALASWLPNYYVSVYDLSLEQAGMLAAVYALPASVFRALGGWLSDRIGARAVMYWTYGVSLLCLFVLSYPQTRYIIQGIDGPIEFSFGVPLALFALITVVLGFVMSLGKAAVYKHIPVYYPDHVGSVGGLVGMIGGLGGFFLPIIFGALNDLLGVWTSCFMLLFLLVLVSLLWMHGAIVRMERRRYPERGEEESARYLPEIQLDYGREGHAAKS